MRKYVRLFEQYEESLNEAKTAVKVVYRVLGQNFETVIRNTTEKDAVDLLSKTIVGNWQLVSTEKVNESAILEGNKKFRGKTVKDLLKVAGKKLGDESFLVQDADGREWAVFPDMDTQLGDEEIYGMDQYDNEQMVKVRDISLVYEGRLLILTEAKEDDLVKAWLDMDIQDVGDEEYDIQMFVKKNPNTGHYNQAKADKLWAAFEKEADKRKMDANTKDQFASALEILVYESVNEAATQEYEPPKFLVLPALDPEGNQTPVDKIDAYMRAELDKRESYYKPGIRSANPPQNNDEVKVNIDEPEVD